MKLKKISLKLSGEALMGNGKFGHDPYTIKYIARDIIEVRKLGIEVSVIVGGGNIYRGDRAGELGINRIAGDHMGMLATIINAIALQNVLEGMGVETRVMSAIPVNNICEPYIRRKAKCHVLKNRIIIFAAGTGNPFFTTDSAAVLRAVEMSSDVLLKGTHVDGVYDKDPIKYNDAVKFDSITYDKVIKQNLNVMDMSAIALARENKLPIRVFSIKQPGNLVKILNGQGTYTEIN